MLSVKTVNGPADGGLLRCAACRRVKHDELLARARARARFDWWNSRDPYIVAAGQLREPVLLVPFERLQRAVSLALGREVAADELLEPARLWRELVVLRQRPRTMGAQHCLDGGA